MSRRPFRVVVTGKARKHPNADLLAQFLVLLVRELRRKRLHSNDTGSDKPADPGANTGAGPSPRA